MPDFYLFSKLYSDSLIIGLIAYSSSISTADFFSRKHKYKINSNQELFALGMSNLISSFFKSFVSSGSLPRTALAESAGSRTQISNIIACLIMLAQLFWLSPFLSELPKACLAAIIIVVMINLFKQFWQKCSKDEVIPDSNNDGFRLRSLLYSSQERYTKYPNFLNPSQYERDLIQQLRNFQGDVKIYSRSFQPSAEIANYLRLLDTNIFIDSRMSVTNQDLNIHIINNLHAKITILGNQVAYIGGINFNFNNSHSHDLMYKTTDTKEINQIISQLPSLHS